MSNDWADERAWEWLRGKIASTENTETFRLQASSLAALLREVEQKGHERHGSNQGKSTHGSCCTCVRCHKFYDECRCDLDDAFAETEQIKSKTLAEVRRVVEEERQSHEKNKPLNALRTVEQAVCDEILRHLEAL